MLTKQPYNFIRRVEIPRDLYEFDTLKYEVMNRVMSIMEGTEAQSGNIRLTLEIESHRGEYTIDMYREGSDVHLFLNREFMYSIQGSIGSLSQALSNVLYNWRGVPGIRLIYNGDRVEPELTINNVKANYYDVENTLYDEFIQTVDKKEWLKNTRYMQEKRFDRWLREHYYEVVEAIYLYDESKVGKIEKS